MADRTYEAVVARRHALKQKIEQAREQFAIGVHPGLVVPSRPVAPPMLPIDLLDGQDPDDALLRWNDSVPSNPMSFFNDANWF
jgi:hypothetical protein